MFFASERVVADLPGDSSDVNPAWYTGKNAERPNNDYVRRFIDSVDTTKVLTVKHIMTVPGSVIKKTDGAECGPKQYACERRFKCLCGEWLYALWRNHHLGRSPFRAGWEEDFWRSHHSGGSFCTQSWCSSFFHCPSGGKDAVSSCCSGWAWCLPRHCDKCLRPVFPFRLNKNGSSQRRTRFFVFIFVLAI